MVVRDVPDKPLGALKTPCDEGTCCHQYEPSWHAAEPEVGGGTLGSDTTGAATRDCTAATCARAKMSLFTTWIEGDGPRNWRPGSAAAGCRDGKRQSGWEEKAHPRQESQARRREEATREGSWSPSGIQ